MSPELSQKLAAAVDRMPAFPKSVQAILDLTRDVNCTPRDLVQVIDKDPVVTVRILKVVNSAYYSLPRQIASINHAVVFLGFNTIKNLALGIAAIGMLPARNEAGFDMQQYLLHSLATANVAKKIAAECTDADPMDGFIAGLLHDFGKVVFAQYLPQEFRQALEASARDGQSLHKAMNQIIGVDHTVVGGMLLEKWRFAPHLVETIRGLYGQDMPDTPMVACVFAANQIAKKLKFGFAGNHHIDELSPAMARRLGGSLDELMVRLGDLQALYEEARVFSHLDA